MSAELLRRAAVLMRERAKAATPGPWHLDGPWWIDTGEYDMVTGHDRKAVMVPGEPTANPSNAEHIASWDPTVALAVADWLDLMAEDYAPYWSKPYAAPFVPVIEKAYRIARAYLGEEVDRD